MLLDVLTFTAAGALLAWATRFLLRVRRGQEAAPEVDRTKPFSNDVHGHY